MGCQTATLGKASVIAFACSGGVFAAPSNIDVDVLVHSPTNISLAMLESWLTQPSPPTREN